jgi:hypothetical protein
MLKTFPIFGLMAALVGWLAYFYWKILRRSLTSHRIESSLPGVKFENFDLAKHPVRYWVGIGTLGMASVAFAGMAAALFVGAVIVH